ncbi:MAG TPA: MFS transporter, partial [Phycisphaerales bacterium]|nr:MFS transporter [Phycisphaerales bacterium]
MPGLNPFAKLPNGRAVWAWGMYDLANQSFTLIVNTLLFSVFFKEVVVGSATPAAAARADSLWSITFAASMLLVVIASPFVGALADARAWRRRFLLGTGLVCVALTCAFAGLSPGAVALAMALYIPANLAYQLGENFLASFLPSVSTPRNIGRISAIGWAMGYLGALALLLVVGAGMKLFSLGAPADWGP